MKYKRIYKYCCERNENIIKQMFLLSKSNKKLNIGEIDTNVSCLAEKEINILSFTHIVFLFKNGE